MQGVFPGERVFADDARTFAAGFTGSADAVRRVAEGGRSLSAVVRGVAGEVLGFFPEVRSCVDRARMWARCCSTSGDELYRCAVGFVGSGDAAAPGGASFSNFLWPKVLRRKCE